jgi:hypothetical protein
MSSLKQIEANRRNALKSTGPSTLEGKERSRCNAVRHGLTAETVIAALDNAEDYQAFQAAVTADYDAESAVERELVLRLASVLWRLRRATGIEAALFEKTMDDLNEVKLTPSRQTSALAADLPSENKLRVLATRQSDITAGNNRDFDVKTEIGNRFTRLVELPTYPLDRLSRYEHLLWRQTRQLVITLESLRRRNRQPSRSKFAFSFRRREPSDFSGELK